MSRGWQTDIKARMQDARIKTADRSFIIRRSSRLALRRAFTLIEATACVLIVTLAASVAAVNLRGVSRRVRLEAALVQLREQDATMRLLARCQGLPGALRFDLAQGQVTRWESSNPPHSVPLTKFDNTTRVTAVESTHDLASGASFSVPCASGRTCSYAVQVTSGTEKAWLVFSGLTGEVQRMDDDANVADIFKRLTGHDAR